MVAGELGIEPFPQDWELISLFEGEPILTDPDVPWVYNRLQFSLRRPNGELHCAKERASCKIEVEWSQDGGTCLALSLSRLSGMEVHTDAGRECLVATFIDNNLESLYLQTRPTISVSWGIREIP